MVLNLTFTAIVIMEVLTAVKNMKGDI